MVSGLFLRGVLVAAVAALRLSHLPRRPQRRRQANQPLLASPLAKLAPGAAAVPFQRHVSVVSAPAARLATLRRWLRRRSWPLVSWPCLSSCGGIMKHRTGLLAIPVFVVAAV